MLLLVPGDPFRPSRVDPHFAPEAEAARSMDVPVHTIDHDALVAGDAQAAVRLVRDPSDDAIYRGWMFTSEQYGQLAEALAGRRVRLRTSPHQYRRAHELPGWYGSFAHVTPESHWLSEPGTAGLEALLLKLPVGSAVLKDYVKSMKHYWQEAAYVPDAHDTEAALTIAKRFLELRGSDLVGGLVVRRFESFVGPEARTWWVGGTCRLVTAHPDAPDAPPAANFTANSISRAVRQLGAPFISVDMGQTVDGRWRVVEVGDGQVSDRPISTDPVTLIRALLL